MIENNEINQDHEVVKGSEEENKDEVQGVKNESDNNESSDNSDFEAAYRESQDNFLRLLAEFDNFKKRTAKERIDYVKSAGQDIVTSILPVLDDFERALRSFENTKEIEPIKEGIDLIFKKFKHTLFEKGLEEIKSKGEVFNPDIHEAITQIPVAEDDMKGKIMDEVEKGYTLGGKVIRHPKVVVGQ